MQAFSAGTIPGARGDTILSAKIMLRQTSKATAAKEQQADGVLSLSLSPNRPAPSRLAFIKLFVVEDVESQRARRE